MYHMHLCRFAIYHHHQCWLHIPRFSYQLLQIIRSYYFLIQPIEKTCIKSCDIMIMSGLTEAPTTNPDTMLGEMCGRMGNDCCGISLTGPSKLRTQPDNKGPVHWSQQNHFNTNLPQKRTKIVPNLKCSLKRGSCNAKSIQWLSLTSSHRLI